MLCLRQKVFRKAADYVVYHAFLNLHGSGDACLPLVHPYVRFRVERYVCYLCRHILYAYCKDAVFWKTYRCADVNRNVHPSE